MASDADYSPHANGHPPPGAVEDESARNYRDLSDDALAHGAWHEALTFSVLSCSEQLAALTALLDER